MEILKKVTIPMTVREYLNTLSTEEFAKILIFAESRITCRYMDTELDALDISFSVEYDMVEWLDSPYCEGKELLPPVKVSIYDDEENDEFEYLDYE